MREYSEIGQWLEVNMDWTEFRNCEIQIISNPIYDEHLIKIVDESGQLIRAWHMVPINYKSE